MGVTREGVVYEFFFTKLPQQGFTASDVVEVYLHRGAFEPQLSDEDAEQDPDRWCSHLACGQEGWQVISQCSRFNIWASDDQAVWCHRKLCHLAREGSGLTSS